MSAVAASIIKPVSVKARVAIKGNAKTFKSVTVSNGTAQKTSANMKTWTPLNNKFFETFSFLPPLSKDEITKQVDYIVRNGWTPCLEFANAETAYTDNANVVRIQNGASCGYYDNRYWTMWKLPMFGCTDGSQVLQEVSACSSAFPGAYIRLVAFDANKQVQVAGFLVNRPQNAGDFQKPADRSL